jgi:peroxiredoxin
MPKVALDKKSPLFSLPDFNGRKYSLSDAIGKRNVLLIFNRGFA